MIIFLCKGLTRNLEMGNTPVYVLPNIWRLGEVGIPNLARMSLMQCYYLQQNARVTASTVSELLRESQQCGGGKITPTTQIRVKRWLLGKRGVTSLRRWVAIFTEKNN